MRLFILSFILHHANRFTKDGEFYAIKNKLLKDYGNHVDYQIQHIPGKKCFNCDGSGQWPKYSMYPPYNIYDYGECYRCGGTGWFKYPQWICLALVKFGLYYFHRPLKRELLIENPWTEEGMGFKVSNLPIIEGYVEHEHSWFGRYASVILYRFYDRNAYIREIKDLKDIWRWRFKRIIRRFYWKNWIIYRPQRFVKHWFDASDRGHVVEDLPF